MSCADCVSAETDRRAVSAQRKREETKPYIRGSLNQTFHRVAILCALNYSGISIDTLDGVSQVLGNRIRETRKKRGLTLSVLAKESGFSPSYISQLERNITDPSISALRKIATVLEAPLYTFLDPQEPQQATVIRANRRQRLKLPGSTVIYQFLSPMASFTAQNPVLEIIYFELNAKSWSREDYSIHLAEECIIVLRGKMTLDLFDKTYELREGDSIYIRENVRHRVYNPGDKKAAAIMCITPPVY